MHSTSFQILWFISVFSHFKKLFFRHTSAWPAVGRIPVEKVGGFLLVHNVSRRLKKRWAQLMLVSCWLIDPSLFQPQERKHNEPVRITAPFAVIFYTVHHFGCFFAFLYLYFLILKFYRCIYVEIKELWVYFTSSNDMQPKDVNLLFFFYCRGEMLGVAGVRFWNIAKVIL